MSKSKIIFICQKCGVLHQQWMGKCKSCNLWGTIVKEFIETNLVNEKPSYRTQEHIIQKITEISSKTEQKLQTKDGELNRVLGGGIVMGSVILISGEPGIGKSTLLLQVALSLNYSVLYVSGEESASQIKLRSNRLVSNNLECFLYIENDIHKIIKEAKKLNPQLIIIDSIQTLESPFINSSSGSVSQIRECASEVIRFAKETQISIIIVGHITKEGGIAGPKILEHMVDVVLQFEGDTNHLFRLLRSQKNRYGSTCEVGIYEMNSQGLRGVLNPSELLISERRNESLSGNSIAAILEGIRPILIEVQALVSSSVYGNPQRSCVGFDTRRLNMLLAVLEKKCGFHLNSKDVFLNLTGGIKIDDPALDLAVIAAILSSNQDIKLPPHCCFSAEVGLSGEIRPIIHIEQRVLEAEKLGYKIIFISKYNKINQSDYQIHVKKVSEVEELYHILF